MTQSLRKPCVTTVTKNYFTQFMGGYFIVEFHHFGVYGVPVLYCAAM